MLRGEAILPGTVVRFDAHGDGVYVGNSHAGGNWRPAQEGYAFRFDADAPVELMHLALMEPTEWRVLPGSELAPRAAMAEGVPPPAVTALPSPQQPRRQARWQAKIEMDV
jgi:hypothetical protein